MVDYTWFRLLVRAIGLTFIGFALPQIITALGTIVAIAAPQSGYTLSEAILDWSGHLLGFLIQLALGLYLFLRGEWVIQHSLRAVYGHCPACTYDLSGHPGPLCPECGIALPGRSAPTPRE